MFLSPVEEHASVQHLLQMGTIIFIAYVCFFLWVIWKSLRYVRKNKGSRVGSGEGIAITLIGISLYMLFFFDDRDASYRDANSYLNEGMYLEKEITIQDLPIRYRPMQQYYIDQDNVQYKADKKISNYLGEDLKGKVITIRYLPLTNQIINVKKEES